MDNIHPDSDTPHVPDSNIPCNTDASNTNVPNRATRARAYKKIPANIVNPIDKSITHLSRKQRSIIRHLPDADSMSQIAHDLRCSKGYVSLTFHLPAVQDYIKKCMDATGATNGKIFKRLAEGLDATRETAKGEDKPDYTQRHKSAMDILKLEGLSSVPDQDANPITSNTIFNIVLQARDARGLDPKPVTPVDVEPLPDNAGDAFDDGREPTKDIDKQ